ncbi:MAG: glycoside hydrolase family 13 protein [Clostridia bacterium]|nr:glycoside hydrolase family 13 protein [Clostridia bacterium]
MLPHLLDSNEIQKYIKIKKTAKGKCASRRGAFAGNEKLRVELEISRKLGITKVYLCLENDNNATYSETEIPFENTLAGVDFYSVTLDFEKMCTDGDGLFFWKIKLLVGSRCFFSHSVNNVDYCFSDLNSSKAFRLLVYNKDFSTPEWAKGAVMYQIFVDRFCKGNKKVPIRNDSKINNDWYDGIPEFAAKNGDPIENNMFFGGTLWGVVEKLDYLKGLGVNIIYLCPIFKAFSNHKYDTGDYETVDEMFGGEEAFHELVKQAKKRGMHIILDGVFNHTGDDSKYFNRYGKYESVGAYQSEDSEYSDWYNFEEFPDKYEAWWGIEILPRLMGDNPKVMDYFLSDNGIVRKWIKMGISGWRLDVADELSENFLEELNRAAKQEKKDALIIGEVWENAADKVSYGKRRKYFRGGQLDSVMNYPVKYAIIDFVKDKNAEKFYNSVTDIYSSYPQCCSDVLMNLVGSHDTERILTILGGESPEGKTNAELSTKKMTPEQLSDGIRKLKVASVLQFTLPGIPMIYYGDEAGLEGYHDPFCRKPYPWGRENTELVNHYTRLSHIKREEASLCNSPLEFVIHNDGLVVYKRGDITVAVNTSDSEKCLKLKGKYTELLCGKAEKDEILLSPMSAKILK